jgi:hypothetical protein
MDGVWVDHPYLLVSDQGRRALKIEVGDSVRRGVAEKGSEHPLLVGGLCDGDASLFDEAATKFESNYSQWADQIDWQALADGGGMLPSQPHYPGDR